MSTFEGEVADDLSDLEEAEYGDRVPEEEDPETAPSAMNRRSALRTIAKVAGTVVSAVGLVALAERVAEAAPRGKRQQKPAPAPEPAPRAARPAPQAEGRNTLRGQRALLDRLFKEDPRIRPPNSEYDRAKVKMWKQRYSGKDSNYDSLLKKYKKRKGWVPTTLKDSLTQGWERVASQN